MPRGFLSSVTPADIEEANSVIHFSSKEPREENYKKQLKAQMSMIFDNAGVIQKHLAKETLELNETQKDTDTDTWYIRGDF